MRKIILTSCGLRSQNLKREFKSLFTKDMKELKVLYIPVASEISGSDDDEWVKQELGALFDSGITKENFIEYHLEYDIDLRSFDVIYMGGGNSFYLLKKIYETQFNNKLREAIEHGVVYVGSSAGSMILGLDIEADNVFFHEENTYLEDTAGLKWIDKIIIPHAQSINNDKLQSFIESKTEKTLTINDGEAIFIIDNKERKA